jgi:predicted DNA binding CopG/RHH family protein
MKKKIPAWVSKEDKEGAAIWKAIEAGELKPVKNSKAMIAMLEEAARNTMKKDARMNIRITKRDILGLKNKAAEEGMPYQTLAASILHKYVTGQLVASSKPL